MSDPTNFGPTQLQELLDLIRSFKQQFGRGNARLTAHFIPNDAVAKGTIYVMHVPKIHLAGSLLGESPNINEEKDYGVAVHPETLILIRAEVNKNVPIPLTDTEIAYVLAVGALGDRPKPEPKRGGISGLNTDCS